MLRHAAIGAGALIWTGCASPQPPPEAIGPRSVSLPEARPSPAPGARTPTALPADTRAVPDPLAGAHDCPLMVPDAIVEAEGVPNGMALVFRSEGAEQRIRELARRWFDELERLLRDEQGGPGVAARIGFSDAPDGAMVTFVPKDLLPDPERGQEDLNAVRDGVERAAEQMRRTRSCPLSAPAGLRLVT